MVLLDLRVLEQQVRLVIQDQLDLRVQLVLELLDLQALVLPERRVIQDQQDLRVQLVLELLGLQVQVLLVLLDLPDLRGDLLGQLELLVLQDLLELV